MLDFLCLSGKKIVVAGASSGIGAQAAKTLSEQGAQLILLARREEKLKEVSESLPGSGHMYYVADLSALDSIEGMVKTIVKDNGPIDGLVFAAGIDNSRPIGQFKPEAIQKVFNTNFFAFVEMVRQVSKKGRFNPGLRIVGLSSIAAYCGDPAHTAYSASKAAMDGAVRCLAKELAPKGICVNTVAPAMTRTAMYDGYLATYGEESETHKDLLKRQYLGVAETVDIANAIAFLISPAARFITGACLPVDGGYTSC